MKTDAETSFGLHLTGHDPMIISTVERGTYVGEAEIPDFAASAP